MAVRVVFDSSAVIAVLRREPGQEVVRPYFGFGAISAVNYQEIVAYLDRRGISREDAPAILRPFRLDVRPHDADLAFEAGFLFQVTRPSGLSLGDLACLALARHLGVAALTTDRGWEQVASDINAEVRLIR
jgi:ribonuclease VapC